jgi:hypothetical protein
MDRYLARTGYQSQLTDQPIAPDRRDNLFEPVPGDHGAHGPFGESSLGSSRWLTARLAAGDAWDRIRGLWRGLAA